MLFRAAPSVATFVATDRYPLVIRGRVMPWSASSLHFPQRFDFNDIDLHVPLCRGDLVISHQPADLSIAWLVNRSPVDAKRRGDLFARSGSTHP